MDSLPKDYLEYDPCFLFDGESIHTCHDHGLWGTPHKHKNGEHLLFENRQQPQVANAIYNCNSKDGARNVSQLDDELPLAIRAHSEGPHVVLKNVDTDSDFAPVALVHDFCT